MILKCTVNDIHPNVHPNNIRPNIQPNGYSDDVIGHDRKLKNEMPNTNFPQISMQKELGRNLLPFFRKKYKAARHLKKYPSKHDSRLKFDCCK